MSDTPPAAPEHDAAAQPPGSDPHPQALQPAPPSEPAGNPQPEAHQAEAGQADPGQHAPAPAAEEAASGAEKAAEQREEPASDAMKALVAALTAPAVVKFTRAPGLEGVPMPKYARAFDAGMDVHAAFKEANQTVAPGDQIAIPTGLSVAIPAGYMLSVVPKSGRVMKQGLTVSNSPGTVDAGYRGKLLILVRNHSNEPQTIHRGEAVAQIILIPVQQFRLEEVEALDETERGEGGFGSTPLR